MLRVRVHQADTTVVRLPSEVDHANASDIGARCEDLIEEGCTTLVLDASDVQYLDSSGVSMIVALSSVLDSRAGRPAPRRPQRPLPAGVGPPRPRHAPPRLPHRARRSRRARHRRLCRYRGVTRPRLRTRTRTNGKRAGPRSTSRRCSEVRRAPPLSAPGPTGARVLGAPAGPTVRNFGVGPRPRRGPWAPPTRPCAARVLSEATESAARSLSALPRPPKSSAQSPAGGRMRRRARPDGRGCGTSWERRCGP